MFYESNPDAFSLGGDRIEGGCGVTLIENGGDIRTKSIWEIDQNRRINELFIWKLDCFIVGYSMS